MGQLAEYIRKKFGVATFVEENPVTDTVGTTVTQIVKNNPDRLALIITNLSANNVYIGWFRDVSANKGVFLAPNGGQVVFLADEDLELVGYEFFAVATAAASKIFVFELIART